MSRARAKRDRRTCAGCGQVSVCHTRAGQPFSAHAKGERHRQANKVRCRLAPIIADEIERTEAEDFSARQEDLERLRAGLDREPTREEVIAMEQLVRELAWMAKGAPDPRT